MVHQDVTTSTTTYVEGIGLLPNSTYSVPERDLVLAVIQEAIDDSSVDLSAVDGLYMPAPRPWTRQGFFSTYLLHTLGLHVANSVEVKTGGTSGGHALHSAVNDIQTGTIETALVVAFERNSVIETTGPYFDMIVGLFDDEFESPIGMTIPGVYSQTMQRYMYEYDIKREDIAEIVVKNRSNGSRNPDALFEESLSREDVLESRNIAEPINLYDCPAPCDGAAALVLTNGESRAAKESAGSESTSNPVRIAGTGGHHAPSHLLMTRDPMFTELPAVAGATQEASQRAGIDIKNIDVFEPYAPFPHIEAIITEELGLVERGEGVNACLDGITAPDGAYPISPSGGCLGRGHPPMVTPLFNHVEAVRQLRGIAATQIDDVSAVMTTAEHGHVNGVTSTVFTTDTDSDLEA